jgi:hypothetical protein
MTRVTNPYYGVSDSHLIELGNRAIWVAAVADTADHLEASLDADEPPEVAGGGDDADLPDEDDEDLEERIIEEGDPDFLPDLNLDTGSPLYVAGTVVREEYRRLAEVLAFDLDDWLRTRRDRWGILWSEVFAPWRDGETWAPETPGWVRELGSDRVMRRWLVPVH